LVIGDSDEDQDAAGSVISAAREVNASSAVSGTGAPSSSQQAPALNATTSNRASAPAARSAAAAAAATPTRFTGNEEAIPAFARRGHGSDVASRRASVAAPADALPFNAPLTAALDRVAVHDEARHAAFVARLGLGAATAAPGASGMALGGERAAAARGSDDENEDDLTGEEGEGEVDDEESDNDDDVQVVQAAGARGRAAAAGTGRTVMRGKTAATRKRTSRPPTATALAAAAAVAAGVPADVSLTPLELQVVALKVAHPSALLLVECGYKYRLFGTDAVLAARTLGVYAFKSRFFMTASVPVHRLGVHVRTLAAAGHCVGVVRQTETAAVKKAGMSSTGHKSGPFTRRLVGLYTRGTLVDDDVIGAARAGADAVTDGGDGGDNLGQRLIMSVQELPQLGKGGNGTRLCMACVDVATMHVVCDAWTDNALREGLGTRLRHLLPVEFVLPAPGALSAATETVLAQFISPEDPAAASLAAIEAGAAAPAAGAPAVSAGSGAGAGTSLWRFSADANGGGGVGGGEGDTHRRSLSARSLL
jgi:DNA mismatch repair protein MSH3